MIISTVTDRRYVELTGVLLRSVCANAGPDASDLIVFGGRLSRRDISDISKCADRPVHFIDMETARHRISRFRTNIIGRPPYMGA